MCKLKIDGRLISTPLYDICLKIRAELHNGKLYVIKPPRNNNITLTCPCNEHKGGREKKPSASIYIGEPTEKLDYGWFSCFTCHSSGPFYHFVAECFDCSDEFAKKWLIDTFSDEVSDDYIELDPIDIPKNNKPKYLSESILSTMEDFHPYMQKRKLSKHICQLFNVKYDPESKSIVFPVYDENHNLIMFTKRSVLTKHFTIPSNVDKPVYLLDYIKKNNLQEAIVTEGQIDCLTCYEYGFPAVATIGSPSQHQIDLLNRSGLRVIYLGFDNDAAGQTFKDMLRKRLRDDILVLDFKIPYPNKKDINDLSKNEFDYCLAQARDEF